MGPGLTCTVAVACTDTVPDLCSTLYSTVLSTQWTLDNICGMDERMIAWIEQCISDQRLVGRGTFYYCRNCTIKRDTWCLLLCTKDEGTPVLSLRQCCATWLLFLLVPWCCSPCLRDYAARAKEWYIRWCLTSRDPLYPHARYICSMKDSFHLK